MVQSIDSVLARRKGGSPAGSGPTAAGRIPPHNLDAEKSLLGAMLLSRDAIAAAMETCGSEDFYKPAHAHIFDAINVLYNQGEPADPVTVADELSRAGLIDSVGGLAALVALQADTPATTNASRYARIVEEHALLRRMISVAGEIAEMGYSIPDDVAVALDHAESLVFNVAERRVTDSLKPLNELLYASMDRLEQLFERGESITGVPTGFVDLDERLYGLQPNALIIVGARPAMGKCCAFDTRVLDAETGEMARIDELFRRQREHPRPFQVASLDEDHQMRPRAVSAWVDDGVKPVFRVTTRLGRTIRTTAAHPFLTPTGWRPLKELEVGSRIGVPRVLRTNASDRMDPAEVKLLAYMLGDGCCTSCTPVLTSASARVVADVTAACRSLGVRVVPVTASSRLAAGKPNIEYRLSAAPGNGENPLTRLLRLHGVYGCGAADKCVPDGIFRLELRQVALFLSRLFATDGTAWYSHSGDGYGRIGYCSISHQLVRDVQHLLLRFGINSRIRFKAVPYKGTRRPAWELELMSRQDISRFCALIGIYSKEDACNRLLDQVLAKREGGYTRDTLPIETWNSVLAAKGDRSWRSIGQAAGKPSSHNWHSGSRSPRRETVALLADVLDDDRLRDHAWSDIYWDEVIAVVPDGEAQVYDLTVPETHNFVADDVFVHNTSFALGMAAHAAVEARVPTLVFSLEMGCDEITNRLLVSEARVDASRMRNGRLQEPDWPKISQAVARLGDAPLYIDDNPNTTVMEIRAKARRLKARQGGLGLIIVDYLQLMSGSSVENRQLEVSSISRGLKVLARELEVPVVALSQLSRQLEARADKRPTLADLRESGCMPASTRLLRADTGEEVTLGELVLSQEQPLVWSLDETSWKMVPRRLLKTFPSGIKPVFRMRLRSGYEVEATGNHKFRTVEGWRRLDELSVGDHLATPRSIGSPEAPAAGWSEDELILLAHLIGDGSIGPNGVKYATSDPANKEAVESSARRLFGIDVAGKKQRNTWLLWLPSPVRLTHGVRHPVRNWLEPHGLWGSRSHNKFIPESIFGLADEQISLFLRHLWATDGSISISRNGRGPVVRVYYATTSRRLADGVRRALLRLGIRSRVSPVRKDGYRECWHVAVTGTPDLKQFLRVVGSHGERGQRIPEALSLLDGLVANPNVDLVPTGVRACVQAALTRAGMSHRTLAEQLGEHNCGSYLLGSDQRPRRFSRRRLERIARACGDRQLAALATSDVYWDEIVEITQVGMQPTFDATIADTHNFVANGVIAHNSLEQDADVVMFLYRDEVYNPESADRGTAEVIISKHRNGPTGKVQLAFLDHYTRFANMARV